MTTISKSISIAARVVLDLHALNNEGSESNRLLTRQVGIVTVGRNEDGEAGYQRSVVNAVSGDMLKHIFADYFRHIALDRGLPLCDACKALDPARMNGNPDFAEYLKSKPSPADVITRLISCALDDVCGILVTGEGTSVKRKSAVEFGWMIGLPGVTEVQEFIHARHAITRLTRTKATKESAKEQQEKAAQEKAANIGQMIFNRPASSGVYAFVAHLDACAIGFNDAEQKYMIDEAQRRARLQAALLSLAQTLIQPKGALTSTQMPHVVDMQGYVSVSSRAATAPLSSPLRDDFVEQAHKVADMNERLYGGGANGVLDFSGADGLLGRMVELADDVVPGTYRE
ncbi:MAG: DevR family CRISPR-associated autoregulator [Anaerolineae bacterium]|nr:DevR family CRISPR-associated autoregulator [Anaerolineae bacterium]MDW8170924.1 DevR family CRISPR-associated autoregulator [Anaerolineae bacterium]